MRDDTRTHARDDDRGQSEALGFVLIFGVVVLTIALVGLTGFTGLEGVQDFQRTTNAEQAFLVLADNVDDVVRAGAPGRSTEIRLTDATLSLESAETTVSVTDDHGSTNSTTVQTHPIVYQSGTGTNITYRSGAVIREDDGSSVLVREPRFVIRDDLVILPIVNATPAGASRVGGTAAVPVRTRAAGTEVIAADETVDSVSLTVTSPRVGVWKRYFERFAGGSISVTQPGANTVELTVDPPGSFRAYVTVHRVDVQF